MAWKIKLTSKAEKSVKKMGINARKQVLDFVYNRIGKLNNPRELGKALIGNHKGLWGYRSGEYRIICQLQDSCMIVLVIDAGHRKLIYNI